MKIETTLRYLAQVAILVVVPVWSSSAEPPQLDFFFPAAVRRGETVTVTAAGKLEPWPVKSWVNRPGLEMEATKDKGKFKVTVSADATGGLYLVRLHNAAGASVLKPLVIGELPQVLEKEPNNKQAEAQVLVESATVNGKLEKGGDVDQYSISLKKGERLVAVVQANQVLGAPMDSIIQLTDPRGFILGQNDDGRLLDPMIVYSAPADGVYTVRVFAFPLTPNSTIGFAGAKNFVYRLTMTTGPFLDHAFADRATVGGSPVVHFGGWNFAPADQPVSLADVSILDPASPDLLLVTRPGAEGFITLPKVASAALVAQKSSSLKQPQEIPIPVVIGGEIESPGDQDVFRFQATKGTAILFDVISRTQGYSMDPLLQVRDAAGKILGEVDDTNKKPDCQLAFVPPADGVYDLLVRDLHHHGGERYVYQVHARVRAADFQLKLAGGTYVLKPKVMLEIPLDVIRHHGFAEEISVTVEGLPAGVSAKAVKSLAKGTSAKKVKLVIQGEAKAFSGAIKIVGTSADGKSKRLAHYLVP
ncbi:MAG: hypothetical protein ABGX05_14625, partial [Pirellulaceae bacterium]